MKIWVTMASSIQSYLIRTWARVFALLLLIWPSNVLALTFEFINSQVMPLSQQEMHALKRAGELWSSKFTDPITIKIYVEWQKKEFFVADEILASVQIGRTTAPVRMVKDTLLAEANNNEYSLLSALPTLLPVSHTSTRAKKVSLTLANAKALGITPANDPRFGAALKHNADAHVSFNEKHRHLFFYDQNLVTPGKYDFTGVVAHEIGHALGFTSIVDIQAMNPGVVLKPMLLDMFRFNGAMVYPSLTFDTRQTTPNFAQFHDEKLTKVFFGSGLDIFDPNHCLMPDRRCSASHWADTTGNLMTSAKKGKLMTLESDDIHAIDRLGVDTYWRNGIPVINARAEFYDVGGTFPDYDRDKFSTNTKAPSFGEVIPTFTAPPTHAFHISFDGHAGAGYAVFVPRIKNTRVEAVNFHSKQMQHELEGQWEAESSVESMKYFPAHLAHFYFQSNNSSYRFNFISTFSDYGSVFDPELGEYGGFRISGFLDGELDGVFSEPRFHKKEQDDDYRGDYDASITILLLLQEPHDIRAGISGAPFAIKWPDKKRVQDNIIHLIDPAAFGAPSGYNNSASYKEAWIMRVKQLDGDTEPGRDIAL
ncbi:NF038122 family metalloprotease [Agarilytica rhodophyticola]|uniref:NF038122 family metalloprotease n=1 Tax=Agarilytica rhodophyticola TaxID=1737490 RepID=UPI000CD83E4B|nr:NF038122 family metalloprotease [Agarilytica rhodophyticola]